MFKRIASLFLTCVLILSLFPKNSFAAVAQNDPKILAYLEEVNSTRGFEMTVEDFNDYLIDFYGMGLEKWGNYDVLKDELGEVIKADLSNLQLIYDSYSLDQASLIQLLEENGDTLDNYIFLIDLDNALSFYLGETTGEDFEKVFGELFSELGLTVQELEALFTHLDSLEAKLTDPAVTNRLEELGVELESFGDFDSIEELTEVQVSQLLSIFNEMLEIFELEPKFYMTKGGEKNQITFEELIELTDPQGYHLLIELYNLNGELILDMILTPEIIGSEIIEDIGEDVKEVPDAVKEIMDASKTAPKTEKGGKLPNTANDYVSNVLAGLLVAAAGVMLYRRIRKVT